MTLKECKDKYAQDKGYKSWNALAEMIVSQYQVQLTSTQIEEVAELYASLKSKEAEERGRELEGQLEYQIAGTNNILKLYREAHNKAVQGCIEKILGISVQGWIRPTDMKIFEKIHSELEKLKNQH